MLVEFIIPTYDRKMPLVSMVASLMAQTNIDWCAHIIVDNPYNLVDWDIKSYFPEKKVKRSFVEKRYNDWGHSLREIGKQQSEADYIVMTGDDNYYTPNFVEELSKVVVNKPGMVYWDMVHSHYHYQYFKCTPAYNQIDMGAFATRTDLAKQIKLNTSYAADGEFVRDFNAKFPFEKKVKIEKVLFVHN